MIALGGQQAYLDFEKTWQYETGIFHRIGSNFDNRLVGYYTYIHDYLLIDRQSTTHGYYGWNLDNVIFWGIEYEFNATIKQLSIFGNYTYKANDVEEDDPQKLQGFWINLPPRHSVKLSFRYPLSDSVLLSWDQRYSDHRRSENGYSLGTYTTSDMGLQYSFYHNKAKLITYVGNLFGENYEEVYGYPMARQTFGATLKYTFF